MNTQFYFMEPLRLFVTIPVACFVLWVLLFAQKKSAQVFAHGIFNSIIHKFSIRTRRHYRFLFAGKIISLFLLVLAFGRPATMSSVFRNNAKGIDIMFSLDLSESMDATDFLPDRITVAKEVITNFIRGRRSDRIGLVTFAGEAVTRVPLTQDYSFITEQIDALKLRELKQGTAIGMGLVGSISRLRSATSVTKIIILVTDGDSNVGSINPVTAAQLARSENIKIYPIGIGKEKRVVIPIYSYDDKGNRRELLGTVPSYLNPELLADIARRTGGRAYVATDAGMLSSVLSDIDRLEPSYIDVVGEKKITEWFMIPLIAAACLELIAALFLQTKLRRLTYAV